MRPTALGHGVYKDVPDYSVFCGDWWIGRIYQTRTVARYVADSRTALSKQLRRRLVPGPEVLGGISAS
jgi:hypothetical protein